VFSMLFSTSHGSSKSLDDEDITLFKDGESGNMGSLIQVIAIGNSEAELPCTTMFWQVYVAGANFAGGLPCVIESCEIRGEETKPIQRTTVLCH